MPVFVQLVSEELQPSIVVRDAVVGIVPAKLFTELALLFAQWQVPVPPAPVPQLPEFNAEAFCRGLRFGDVLAASGLAPVEGKAEEVERVWLALEVFTVEGWPLEAD